ncbi:MAG: hypothetical protein AAFX50_10720, partial [Acidobacteriota bacterium]
ALESFADDRYRAAATLQRAESRLDHLDMTLAVQAARRQRALLIPSAVASDRLADADRRIAELGVAATERMANLLVPGLWQPGGATGGPSARARSKPGSGAF